MGWSYHLGESATVAFWISMAAVAVTWITKTGCAPLPWEWCP